ncbi:hypothetical protein CUC08_Gglean006400 [Alternaria sp. MG1]|nr:hypothetical protein CUC08_Gglean006400 [Alternaria sp. MG1]
MTFNVGLGTEGSVERGWGLWLTSVLSVIIAGLFVSARLAQRFIKSSGLGMDDYMIIAALLSSVLLSVTECQAVVYGYGRHWKDLPADSRVIARKWFYGANSELTSIKCTHHPKSMRIARFFRFLRCCGEALIGNGVNFDYEFH